MSIKLGIVAPLIFGPAGFSRAGRLIMFELYKLGVDIRLVNVVNPTYDRIVTVDEYEQIKQFASNTWQPDVWFNLAPSCAFTLNNTFRGWKIGMSMWETLENPPTFAQTCALCDEIWVPSTFNFKTFNEYSAVPKERLAWMPLGVDTELYQPRRSKIRISDDFRSQFDFVYGIVCGYSARKGVDLVLNAHHELFNSESNVALFVKGDDYARRLFPQDMTRIYEGNPLIDISYFSRTDRSKLLDKLVQNKPVVLYNFDALTDLEMVEVFLAMDCLVFPSRGEGQGLPVLEAMACGKPVIGTKATGMDDTIHEGYSYVVPSKGWKPEPHCDWITGNYKGRSFADPDYFVYRDLVQHVYTHQEEAKQVGIRGRQFVVDNFSAPVIATRMKRRLEEIAGGRLVTSNFWPENSPLKFNT